jgi:hypothetical protein
MKQQEIDALKSVLSVKPTEWQMDQTPHIFVKNYGPNSAIGKEITKLMMEYEEKCAIAKIEMYVRIHTLIKQKHPKLPKPFKHM